MMHLRLIEERIESSYYRTPEQLLHDLRQIAENSKIFNREDSELTQKAISLVQILESIVLHFYKKAGIEANLSYLKPLEITKIANEEDNSTISSRKRRGRPKRNPLGEQTQNEQLVNNEEVKTNSRQERMKKREFKQASKIIEIPNENIRRESIEFINTEPQIFTIKKMHQRLKTIQESDEEGIKIIKMPNLRNRIQNSLMRSPSAEPPIPYEANNPASDSLNNYDLIDELFRESDISPRSLN